MNQKKVPRETDAANRTSIDEKELEVAGVRPLKVGELLSSLYGLSWFFGAAIGAPSLIQIVRSTLVDFDPGYFLGAVLEAYNNLTVVLNWVTRPLQDLVIRTFSNFPLLLPKLSPTWLDIFAILLIWSAAISRTIHLRRGKLLASAAFASLFLGAAVTSILYGMVDVGQGIASELLIPFIPVAIISVVGVLFWFVLAAAKGFQDRSELKGILSLIGVPIGTFILCCIPVLVSYYVIGLKNGQPGVYSFLLLTFVVAAGAAYDSSKAGDRLSAELFLMILGPYVGMMLLIGAVVIENSVRHLMIG